LQPCLINNKLIPNYAIHEHSCHDYYDHDDDDNYKSEFPRLLENLGIFSLDFFRIWEVLEIKARSLGKSGKTKNPK